MAKTILDRARQLEAEAKELRRQEKRFWEEVSARCDEVLSFLNVGQTFEEKETFDYGSTNEIQGKPSHEAASSLQPDGGFDHTF